MYEGGHVKGEAAASSSQNHTVGLRMAILTCFATDITASRNGVSSKDGLVVHGRRRSYERRRDAYYSSHR